MIQTKNKLILLVTILFSFTFSNLFAQLKNTPVWKITSSKTAANIGDEIDIVLTSVIEKDWYMYSNDMDPNLGPITAEFTWAKDKSYQLVGKTTPIGSHKHYEEVWPGTVSTMKGTAKFIQKVKILTANPKIKVALYFQECSEVTGMCMPPYEQEYEVKNLNVTASNETTIENNTDVKNTENVISTTDTSTNIASEAKKDTLEKAGNIAAVPLSKPATESFLSFLILAFLGGLIAVATPCVFPMLPMTVSFFTKKSSTSSRIIIIYPK